MPEAKRATRSRVIVVTEAELAEQLARLDADRREWLRLIDRYGSLDVLDSEIDSRKWLRGDDRRARGSSTCKGPKNSGENSDPPKGD